MSLICDPTGQIAVSDIMDAINENTDEAIALKADVVTNTSDISLAAATIITHTNQLSALQAGNVNLAAFQAIEASVFDNTNCCTGHSVDIAANTAAIASNKTDSDAAIVANAGDITLTNIEVTALTDSQAVMFSAITDNTNAIAAITGTPVVPIVVGAALYVHEGVSGSDGGSSNATWTPRNISTERYDTIGCNPAGATLVIPPAGDYNVYAVATAEGSVHQSKLMINGVPYMGTLCSGSGQSIMVARVIFNGTMSVGIETIVETPVANTGFGVTNPFADDSVYVMLSLEKV